MAVVRIVAFFCVDPISKIAPFIDMQNTALQENVWTGAELESWKQHAVNIFLPSQWHVERQAGD